MSGDSLPSFSAVQVGPAGGVRVEVVLAEARRVVGGGKHVGGGQRRREVVARLLVDVVEVVLVQRLWRWWRDTQEKKISSLALARRHSPRQDKVAAHLELHGDVLLIFRRPIAALVVGQVVGRAGVDDGRLSRRPAQVVAVGEGQRREQAGRQEGGQAHGDQLEQGECWRMDRGDRNSVLL